MEVVGGTQGHYTGTDYGHEFRQCKNPECAKVYPLTEHFFYRQGRNKDLKNPESARKRFMNFCKFCHDAKVAKRRKELGEEVMHDRRKESRLGNSTRKNKVQRMKRLGLWEPKQTGRPKKPITE